MKRQMLLLMLGIIILAGCAQPVQKELVATGGSKADGIIELSYEYDEMYEKPVVDLSKGERLAAERCKSWGFKRSESFGSETKKCNLSDGYGNCRWWFVSIKFQCLDN